MDGWIEYIILFVLIMVNAFFAASELAIVNARKTRMKQLAEEGNRGARAVLRLSDNPRKFLATIQVGVTLSSFFTSAFGAVSLVNALEASLKSLGKDVPALSFLNSAANTVAFIVVTVLVAFVSLILGELVPKTLAVEASESIALRVARSIEFLAKIASPVVSFLTFSTNIVVRLLGGKRTAETPSVTPEEVVSMVSLGQEEGVFVEQQEDIIRGVFEFSEKRVHDVMIPRPDMLLLDGDKLLSEIAPLIVEAGYSRYPIYTGGNRDNIKGIVFTKDVLKAYVSGQTETRLHDLARQPYFVPESKLVSALFTELQKSRTHIAVAVDEYGSVSGIVTLEDLLEEIVGEIQDEFDHEENIITPLTENEYLINGSASLLDVNSTLALSLGTLPDGSKLAVDTLAGLVMALMERIPQTGDSVRMEFPPRADFDSNDTYPDAVEQKPAPLAAVLTVTAMEALRISKVNLKLEYLRPLDDADSAEIVPAAPSPAVSQSG